MIASLVKGSYFELTLYMNLWNNEIISHPLSARCEDRMTNISGSRDLIELKKHFWLCRRCALRSGSHICIEGFTELLPMYKAVSSVSNLQHSHGSYLWFDQDRTVYGFPCDR